MAAIEHSADTTGADTGQRSESKSNLGELHDRLDSLWITYLNHLDAYTSAQKLLQKHMKAGFLSLARANFEARTGVRKYGQDYYHDRPVATKRTAVLHPDGKVPLTLRLVDKPPSAEDGVGGETLVQVQKTGEKEEDVTQLPSPPGTPEPVGDELRAEDDDQAHDDEDNGDQMAKKAAAKLPLESDPLRWFGILVPASLRSAQTSFQAAVEEAMVESVISSKAMRSVEADIRKLRKEVRRAERERGTVRG